MKNVYIFSIIGALILAVAIGAIGYFYYITHDWGITVETEWENITGSGILWEKGEIVHIAQHDEGYLLYLDPMGTGRHDYLIEYLVTDDTHFEGEHEGVSLEQMLKDLTPGAFVKMSYYNYEAEMIVPGHYLYVAYYVSVTEEVSNY